VGSHIEHDDIWIRVDASAWFHTGQLLKERHGFDYFCFLSGIDWTANAQLASRYEKVWDPEPEVDKGTSQSGDEEADAEAAARQYEVGVAGGETRFQVFARLYNIDKKYGITIKADLDSDKPAVQSWVSLYRGADWHERETWEMFGFDFEGHPSLRHLYLPSEFEGFPLRKDFPLLSRAVKPWPGLVDKEPIPGEDEGAEEGASA
jgi:NADH-quinone oxidoreductase subunit C